MKALGMVPAWMGIVATLILLVPRPAAADEPCKGRGPLDPRTARLQVLDLRIGGEGIVGKVKNTSGETAIGVMVWVNYYIGRRGGLSAQQCIPVGDLQSGEERSFLAIPISEADGKEAFDYAVAAVGWR